MRKYRAGNAARDLFDGCVRNDVYIIEINTRRETHVRECQRARPNVRCVNKFYSEKKREKKIERERKSARSSISAREYARFRAASH